MVRVNRPLMINSVDVTPVKQRDQSQYHIHLAIVFHCDPIFSKLWGPIVTIEMKKGQNCEANQESNSWCEWCSTSSIAQSSPKSSTAIINWNYMFDKPSTLSLLFESQNLSIVSNNPYRLLPLLYRPIDSSKAPISSIHDLS